LYLLAEKSGGSRSKGSSHLERTVVEREWVGSTYGSWFADNMNVGFGEGCVVLGADLRKID